MVRSPSTGIPFPRFWIHNLRVRATRSVTTDSSAPGPRPVSAERVSRAATPALVAKYVMTLPTHAMRRPATTTEPARPAKTAATVRTTADRRPTGILAAGIAATVTCPIAAIRGVPRAAGLAVVRALVAVAHPTRSATTASSATAPRHVRVGVARVAVVRAQARAVTRAAICALRAAAIRPRAMPTAIAAPATARTGRAEATDPIGSASTGVAARRNRSLAGCGRRARRRCGGTLRRCRSAGCGRDDPRRPLRTSPRSRPRAVDPPAGASSSR